MYDGKRMKDWFTVYNRKEQIMHQEKEKNCVTTNKQTRIFESILETSEYKLHTGLW